MTDFVPVWEFHPPGVLYDRSLPVTNIWVRESLGPCSLLPPTWFHCVWWLSMCPFFVHTTSCLCVRLLMDIMVASKSWLLSIAFQVSFPVRVYGDIHNHLVISRCYSKSVSKFFNRTMVFSMKVLSIFILTMGQEGFFFSRSRPLFIFLYTFWRCPFWWMVGDTSLILTSNLNNIGWPCN